MSSTTPLPPSWPWATPPPPPPRVHQYSSRHHSPTQKTWNTKNGANICSFNISAKGGRGTCGTTHGRTHAEQQLDTVGGEGGGLLRVITFPLDRYHSNQTAPYDDYLSPTSAHKCCLDFQCCPQSLLQALAASAAARAYALQYITSHLGFQNLPQTC
jgi:hypothetical protein